MQTLNSNELSTIVHAMCGYRVRIILLKIIGIVGLSYNIWSFFKLKSIQYSKNKTQKRVLKPVGLLTIPTLEWTLSK